MVDFSFIFLFLRSCSCLRLFTWVVIGSEWQENVTGTSTGLCGIPRVFHISRRTLCDSQMQNSLYTWPVLIYMGRLQEQGTIQLPDSTSHFPIIQKDVTKGNRERRENCVKEQPTKEMFDIDLNCEGGVQSQMCVFVIKQVWIFHLRQKARIFSPSRHYVLLLFFLLQHHKHQFSPTSKLWPHPFIGSSFWKTVLLIFILLKKNVMSSFEEREGVVCGFAFSQIPSQRLNQLLKSNWEALKETPTFLITALPQTLILFQSYSQAGEYL